MKISATERQKILKAMRADKIKSGISGKWKIRKIEMNPVFANVYFHKNNERLPTNTYTFLYVSTPKTVNQVGECVMEDTPSELRKHLDFILKAKGNVLVGGLGLGCVVRGLLAKKDIKKVTVLEKDSHVIRLVRPYLSDSSKLEIIETDAIEWCKKNKIKFDYVWMDLWNDVDSGEQHLDITHTELAGKCRRFTNNFGAWNMNKTIKRDLIRRGIWYE